MKIIYGVEANYIIEEVPECKELIEGETTIFDYHDSTFIYETKEDASLAEDLLREVGLFENQTDLILVGEGEKGDTFFDFGMESSHGTYLLKELLCAFSIVRGNSDAIQMATFQLQEHFIFKAESDIAAIYFAELHLQDLIEGIAVAYDIEVSFFELDK
ncbi:hypothetical protein BGM26_10305 [Bacillus sp. FJAT-29790]|uniref:hypothetical protein n=1 Tax=Bacillus sp. FJAT-29790 TaxID=1895002 RepID=UPI001C2465C5|nr:hypothetical protein [Bacillus sp. FJAT-29790]MBU8879375.1 hypothetical protein [Bacillus sp. FJAT-29790]